MSSEEKIDPYVERTFLGQQENAKILKFSDFDTKTWKVKLTNNSIYWKSPTEKVKVSKRDHGQKLYLRQFGKLTAYCENNQLYSLPNKKILGTFEKNSDNSYAFRTNNDLFKVYYYPNALGKPFCESDTTRLFFAAGKGMVIKFVQKDFTFSEYYLKIHNTIRGMDASNTWVFNGTISTHKMPFSPLEICFFAQENLPLGLKSLWISSLDKSNNL